MANVVIMPKQGQSVESCIVTKWHKKVGDEVKVGDLLFSYETDKAAFDYESEVEGTLLALLAEEGDDVPCLQNLCIIGDKGEDISEYIQKSPEAKPETSEAPEAMPEAKAATIVETQQKPGDNVFVSPRAKKAAERQGVNASMATPTGANGRVMERDVYRLSEQEPVGQKSAAVPEPAAAAQVSTAPAVVPAQADYTDEKLSNVRKVIARNMHKSLATMAQLTNNITFDATNILEYRKRLKASGSGVEDITINDMMLFAVSRALLRHPALNAHFLDDKIRKFNTVNLGVAVDTDRGLLVPTLYNAEKKSLMEISKQTKELISAARSGRIDPELLANGTFTVTNLGTLGVESFTPVINPPQVAILGVCSIVTRVREREGKIETYPAMGLSLTFDHRAVDGAPTARFAKELAGMLENFYALMAL